MSKWVVIEIAQKNHPEVLQTILCHTYEQALDVAAKIAMEYNGEPYNAVKEEIEIYGAYVPEKYTDWTVCIDEVIDTPADVATT